MFIIFITYGSYITSFIYPPTQEIRMELPKLIISNMIWIQIHFLLTFGGNMSNNNWDDLYEPHTYLITGGYISPVCLVLPAIVCCFFMKILKLGLKRGWASNFFLAGVFYFLFFFIFSMMSSSSLSFEP